MEHPKQVGDRSTLAVMLALAGAGYSILLPFGENTRYDLAIEKDGRLFRVQCKTGRLHNGTVLFKTASTYSHHPRPAVAMRSYHGEIDYFGVYCPGNGAVYLIPFEAAPNRSSAALRVEPSRNGQKKRIRDAAEYEIARIPVTKR
jgi:PD-(D/E)XK endonuclease